MDGNTAAAHVSYAFTEVAGIYPITPSSGMAELTDKWAADGLKNIFGQTVRVVEMQSEGGAAGVVHGSLAAGALTTTYTASQGLLLMIPNMFKIAGELLPGVIHCSARALASHALSIFGDHSDVMSCRQTGFAFLAATNPQEVMHLGAVAHLSAISGRVPFLHFFDGFRTSHEMQKIDAWDYDELKNMVDMDAIQRFRDKALNPENPVLRGTAQNPDIFFQAREACNPFYNALPAVVEANMAKVNAVAGTNYQLFNYYGASDAEEVIVAMGSVCDTIEETIDYMLSQGRKVGLVKVRLYRPFVSEKFIAALPATVKKIAVLDRTKEPGALGEPLFVDVITALTEAGKTSFEVCGGRYGLGSKDVPPSNIVAVYDNLLAPTPKKRFTIGIHDDVTYLSLPIKGAVDSTPEGTVSCKFWGLGADGTVGANRDSTMIIGGHTDLNVQAYFAFDSKKSGGVTISHLRFGKKPIKSTYFVSMADFVACHNPSYVDKYDMVKDVRPGGKFLLSCAWDIDEMTTRLPAAMKSYIAKNNVELYAVDAIGLAHEINKRGLGVNLILQAAFFKLADIIPLDDAVKYMKDAAVATYGRKGEAVVDLNLRCIDAGIANVKKIDVPAAWATATDGGTAKAQVAESNRPEMARFVKDILLPITGQHGDQLPVSTFKGVEDGTFPQGSAAYEKRSIAVDVPAWKPDNCVQCNICSYVCPHAIIRPYALDEKEVAAAPAGLETLPMLGKGCEAYQYTLAASYRDCMGCGVCANVCLGKKGEKALVMEPLDAHVDKQQVFDYAAANVTDKETHKIDSVKGSQFLQPLLEFSGACSGCGETPYAKLITQLYGDRMYIANATGCSSIWGGSAPSTPYTVNKEGKGPTWANSLFEDNAEYGYGMYLGMTQRRQKAAELATALVADNRVVPEAKAAIEAWLGTFADGEASKKTSKAMAAALANGVCETKNCSDCTTSICGMAKELLAMKDTFTKKSFWVFGGDGWAFDIGFGGLDHVLAAGEDVNILVFDTEVYSNTGGQMSKASQLGQVAQFSAAGKRTAKKDLAQIVMSYGYVYVAQVAMGSDYPQTIKAITEAESFPGPSIVIAYSPCIAHGIPGGMANTMLEAKRAVEAGYWHNFRFDPRLKNEGKNPFQLDSKAPTASYEEFIRSEGRYDSLVRQYPEAAEQLFVDAVKSAEDKYRILERMIALHEQ
ncbi:MAG: pyruvate:ferredoxin (flavodoxin) oxidoreductase [Lachnospiraceae bacterium]|jgi:pyruvate-ferredoxin/flavodoxin oxidoreductase|nr:pyruvate:ferredoxin (flavodoxin) oxidoreductase [Lachnospiraceae bacterium]